MIDDFSDFVALVAAAATFAVVLRTTYQKLAPILLPIVAWLLSPFLRDITKRIAKVEDRVEEISLHANNAETLILDHLSEKD